MKKTITTILTLITLVSCGLPQPVQTLPPEVTPINDGITSDGGNEEELIPNQVVTFNDIQRRIIQPYGCANCHNYARTEEGFQTRLVAGEPFSSPAYLRIRNGSMPLNGPEVPTADLEFLERYIEQMN